MRDKLKQRFASPITPDGHEARVARVMADVKRYAEARRRGDPAAQKPLRTDRKGAASLNTRMADKSQSQTVRMGDVSEHLDGMGLQLEATIEMKDATMGGLDAAASPSLREQVQ